jgi:HEAT repeat protein
VNHCRNMTGHRICFRLPVAAYLLVSLTGGCASNDLKLSSLAFWKSEPASTVRTRADQIKDLRSLAEDLPASGAEKHQQVTLELAQAIRAERDPIIRAQIVRTLGYCPTPGAGQVVRAGVQDSDAQVRVAACEALGRRGGSEAVTILSNVLTDDTDIDVRLAAARCLGDTRDTAAVEALAAALEDPNPALQLRGMRSLEKVTGKQFGDDVEAWRTFAKGGTPQPRSQSIASRVRQLF